MYRGIKSTASFSVTGFSDNIRHNSVYAFAPLSLKDFMFMVDL